MVLIKDHMLMAKTATVRARVEPEIKNQAEQVFSALGISMSEAMNLFLHQTILRKGLPFDAKIPNAETIAALNEDLSGATEHADVRQMHADILAESD